MAGSVFKRCGCPDAAGKPMGSDCPKLKKFDHSSWYKAELPPGPGGSRRRVRKGGFATKRDAHQALTDLLDRVNKRTHLSTSTETMATYLTRWLAGKGGLRPSTRRSYEAHVRLYLIPGIGHLRLGDLSVEDVEELYDALRKLGRTRKGSAILARLLDARHASSGAHQLTDASIRRVHATLMSALNTAAKRRLIPFNPASFVELASGKRPRRSCGPTNGSPTGAGPASGQRWRSGPQSRLARSSITPQPIASTPSTTCSRSAASAGEKRWGCRGPRSTSPAAA
jgi:hypothetical protein